MGYRSYRLLGENRVVNIAPSCMIHIYNIEKEMYDVCPPKEGKCIHT